MNIKIIAVGKIKEKYIKEGISEFSKRLSRYCSLDIVEVSDEKAQKLQQNNKKQEIELSFFVLSEFVFYTYPNHSYNKKIIKKLN